MTILSVRFEDDIMFVQRIKKVLAVTTLVIFGITYEEGSLYPTTADERITCPRQQLNILKEHLQQTGQ